MHSPSPIRRMLLGGRKLSTNIQEELRIFVIDPQQEITSPAESPYNALTPSCRKSRFKNLSDFLRQGGQRKWLLEKIDAFIQDTVVPDYIFAVP